MESLIKLQGHYLQNVTKAKSNFLKSSKERITVSYIETRVEALEKVWQCFFETHNKIVCEHDAEYSESNYCKLSVYDSMEELYMDYKCGLKEKLDKLKSKNRNSSSASEVHVAHDSNPIKLPKIVLPTFSGKYLEWPTFRDLYETLIHKNASLADVQKLHYLKSHLTDEAEQLVRHIPITEANYVQCWELLTKRYSNKRYISNCILNRLLSQKQLSVESSYGIKQLLDTTCECLNALSNLGVNVSSWDILIIHLIAHKLDSETRKQWESKASELSDELPTLALFKEFLEHKFRSLEFLDPKTKPKVYTNIAKTAVHVASTNDDVKCQFCQGNHKIVNCKEFAKEEYNSRHNFVQSNRLCFNCLGINHPVFSCRQTARCRICKRKHHSLLHPKEFLKSPTNDSASGDKAVVAVSTTATLEESKNVVACFSNASSQVLLATALVRVESEAGDSKSTLKCLLDQGSQASFITESAVQALGLQKLPNKISVTGVGGQGGSLDSKAMVAIKLQSIHDPRFTVVVNAHVLRKLTTLLPAKKVVIQFWPELTNMKLADPKFNLPNKVDLLLGAEVYCQILEEGLIKGPPGCPVAQKTKLGWILSGQCISGEENESKTVVALPTQVDDNELLRKFWELEAESFSAKKILTQEEQRCEDIFLSTTKRDETGRYIVKLPFRDEDPKCTQGKTEQIATKRFQMLEKRFSKDEKYKEQYANVMKEYLDLGHMELVPEDQRRKADAVYLPHHGVTREDKITTKLRVVYDASCVGVNGVSLNNDLLVGPNLQLDLRHIVMRWRRHKICLVADIVKIYRQVKVTKEDSNFQRIVWRDEHGVLQHYRMLRITFGTASAPYLAVRVLHQIAQDEGQKYELAAEKVLADFYMDDLMTGCNTIDEGLMLYKDMNELMRKGRFQLQKWISNSQELMELIGLTVSKEEKLQIGSEKGIQKVLGLTWNNESDQFEYSLQILPLNTPVTKRKVISDISRLFDPLGWIGPIIIRAKIFIQKLWISGIGWDQELPPQLLQEWLSYRRELSQVTNFSIPRWIHMSLDDVHLELHGFSDASCEAYAAVVYSRVIDKNGKVQISLITSKTKVSPIKQISIPRLELCGAQLLARLLHEVSEILEIEKDHVHAWTDSSVVLAWLSSHPNRWKTFVANRVSDILQLYDRSCWSHVKSKDNPADAASRGVSPTEFTDLQLWKQGPVWLSNKEIDYSPLTENSQIELDTKQEIKSVKLCGSTAIDNHEHELFDRFSSLRKLVRVVAFCRRFYELTHVKPKPTYPAWLTSEELKNALKFCIIECQKHCFGIEIDDLTKSGTLSKKSKLASLNPIIDSDGILRVGGRLQKAQILESRKHPILIPEKSRFTELIIEDAHEKTLHGGPQLMVNYIRTKYWVLKAKNLAKLCARHCIKCLRYSARANQPLMGQLPEARTSPSRPFWSSGVDYAGPFAIRTTKGRGHHATKGYICLFICMATRAIHLEVVSDMTSQGFIAAFRRFVARRGHCEDLWSDNGTNFVGADRELKTLLLNEKSTVASEIVECLANNGTTWHRIPAHSPNFGGLWEAGVKSTKHHLKRVIGESTLTFEEFITVLAQIEACLNSRPISQMSENVEDPFPLTPGHFLVGEPLILIPDANYEKSNVTNLRRWQLTQRMVQDFWRRWSREYLTQFYHRYKWNQNTPEPKVGDVVLVMEDDLPPAKWLYGIIIEKHSGLDKVTRVVSLRCKNTVIKRPVSKLCILPVTD